MNLKISKFDFIKVFKKIRIPLFLGILVLIILIPNSPHFKPISGDDQAVFVNIGDHILEGEIPYLDHFDNKGPLTFYINAMGLALRPDGLWGTWAIQIPFLFFAALLGFKAMSKVFSQKAALFGSVVWIVNVAQSLRGGNYSEEYAILFQFATLLFFILSEENRKKIRYPMLMGVSFALAFLLRPNNIGIPLSILILLGISFIVNKKNRAMAIRRILFILLGFVAVLGVVAIYFLSVGALDELIDAVFVYNFSLHGDVSNFQNGRIIDAMYSGASRLGLIFLIAFVGWVLAITQTFSEKSKGHERNSIYALMAIALPVEMFLATFGGVSFSHYFINWYPILGLLSAYFAYTLLASMEGETILLGQKIKLASIRLFAILFFVMLIPLYQMLPKTTDFIKSALENGRPTRAGYSQQVSETVSLITHLTEKDDYLLMWGYEMNYYFLADRDSPSRFDYLYPFIYQEFTSQAMIDELLLGISSKRPLIIDSSVNDGSSIPWIGAPHWEEIPGMSKVLDYILENYAQVAEVGPKKWPVYQYDGIGCVSGFAC